jgi:hypothetical protein
MLFMNEHEIDEAVQLHAATIWTEDLVALEGALVLRRLKDWTNENSDGWPYWSKPVRSAGRLMQLLQDREARFRRGYLDADRDVTPAELRAALTPIKSFLTRHGVSESDRLWILEGKRAKDVI